MASGFGWVFGDTERHGHLLDEVAQCSALDSLPDKHRAKLASELTRRLITELAREPRFAQSGFAEEAPTDPAKLLRAVSAAMPDGRPEEIPQLLIPLLDTALLTNG